MIDVVCYHMDWNVSQGVLIIKKDESQLEDLKYGVVAYEFLNGAGRKAI